MPRKCPIHPFERTPEGIREYQKNQPYPDFEKLLEEKKRFFIAQYIKDIMYNENAHNNVTDFDAWILKQAENALLKKRQSQTTLSWDLTRFLVFERDEGICDICKDKIEYEVYQCGHIIDRVCGGSDRLENLVCMCSVCNTIFKPLHETKEQYAKWKETHRENQRTLEKIISNTIIRA